MNGEFWPSTPLNKYLIIAEWLSLIAPPKFIGRSYRGDAKAYCFINSLPTASSGNFASNKGASSFSSSLSFTFCFYLFCSYPSLLSLSLPHLFLSLPLSPLSFSSSSLSTPIHTRPRICFESPSWFR